MGGLPCIGTLYDEVVPCVEEQTRFDRQGQHFLPPSCCYLFLVYLHFQNQIKRQGKVNINDWISLWFRGLSRYKTPRKQAKRIVTPKSSQNPFGMVSERGPWSDEEHMAFVDLQVPNELREETYLAALLSCWLCAFVFPLKDLHNIQPSTFKIASLMANGRVFGLAASILASIY